MNLRSGLFIGAALCLTLLPTVEAASAISNGGFESGLAAWTRVDSLGSDGTFFTQSGTQGPANADPVPAPPQGTWAAMSDAQGPGSHVLYQDFVAMAGPTALRFSLFIGNRADRFATPPNLDWTTEELNQQGRVDILKAGSDPFSVAAGDILQSLYQSAVGDPLVEGYAAYSFDLSALLAAHDGQTLRLRFAEADNLASFQMGVDDVRFESLSPIPEPSSALLLVAGCVVILMSRRRTLSRPQPD